MGRRKKIKYYARPGATFKQGQAQLVGETLAKMKEETKLTPDVIVSEAKKKANPLHKFFEWNDGKAAQKYRLQQARDMIAGVTEVIIIQGTESKQRSFFSVGNRHKSKAEYVTIREAISKKPYRDQLLTQIISQLENLATTMKLFKEQV